MTLFALAAQPAFAQKRAVIKAQRQAAAQQRRENKPPNAPKAPPNARNLEGLPPKWVDKRTRYHINPTGRFVVGGPVGDCGLTGRKIIVDTYGGFARHGGGAFSGKDPSKVDRSAAYAARYVAKNIVAAGLAERCEVQLSYAIGVADPTSIMVETFGTGKLPDQRLTQIVRAHFDLTPFGLREMLDLARPIYQKTAAYGHFGRKEEEFSWERTDKADVLAAELKGSRAA